MRLGETEALQWKIHGTAHRTGILYAGMGDCYRMKNTADLKVRTTNGNEVNCEARPPRQDPQEGSTHPPRRPPGSRGGNPLQRHQARVQKSESRSRAGRLGSIEGRNVNLSLVNEPPSLMASSPRVRSWPRAALDRYRTARRRPHRA